MNRIKTTFLLTCLTLLLVAMGIAMGGQSGMIIAFVIAAGMNLFSYWYSDKIVLKTTFSPIPRCFKNEPSVGLPGCSLAWPPSMWRIDRPA